jgi:hypothetical protein
MELYHECHGFYEKDQLAAVPAAVKFHPFPSASIPMMRLLTLGYSVRL